MKKILFLLLCVLILPVSIKAVSITQDLKQGMRGEQIKTLQQFLIDNGYLKGTVATGFYGPATVKSVKVFQKDNGISQTGIVGSLTRRKLTTNPTTKLTKLDASIPRVNDTPALSIQPNTATQPNSERVIEKTIYYPIYVNNNQQSQTSTQTPQVPPTPVQTSTAPAKLTTRITKTYEGDGCYYVKNTGNISDGQPVYTYHARRELSEPIDIAGWGYGDSFDIYFGGFEIIADKPVKNPLMGYRVETTNNKGGNISVYLGGLIDARRMESMTGSVVLNTTSTDGSVGTIMTPYFKGTTLTDDGEYIVSVISIKDELGNELLGTPLLLPKVTVNKCN